MRSTKRSASRIAAVVIVLSSLGVTRASQAEQIVIPGSLANTEANANTTVTGFVGANSITVQIQITAAELAALGLETGEQITGIRQRLNGPAPAGPTSPISVSDLEITMAGAANAIGSMSTTFADNMTSPVIVRDGAYTLPANSMPSGSSPNAFGPLVAFDSAYTYAGGSLIFMYTRPATTSLSLDAATTYAGEGTAYRTLIAPSTHHATTGNLDDVMGVFQFEVVPEPTGLGFVGMAAAMMLRRKR